ncbi:toxic anion resistance protein [Desulfovibrio sp. OttesenSCG-928-C06]|nr:toxic anion resistance protein [Desulfovibrio sp. OttesenSCG-928-C06]
MQDNAIATAAENLPTQTEQQIKEVAATIDFNDPALTVSYGAKTMNAIAGFADNLLNQVRAKDAGPVGEILTDLLLQVKSIDIEKFNDKGSALSKIPLIGSMFNSIEKNMAHMKKVTDQMEEITTQLDRNMVSLITDIELLEQLFESNKAHHQDLTVYIEAGKQRLEQARNEDLQRLKAEAEASGDSMKAQEVRDFAERLNRFERRLHDLQVSRTITVQTVPQIRMIQGNNQTLAEKIQTSVMTTIPIWKNQMVLAITLYRQQKAVDMQKKVADTTNELLKRNAEMLESASTATAREVERSIVDIETIRDVHSKLISTIEESLAISAAGRQKRREAEKELGQMENNLRERLVDIADKEQARLIEQDNVQLPE